jgi:hypothetical protein
MLDRPNMTYLRICKWDHLPRGGGLGTLEPVDPIVNAEFNPDMVRTPKQLRRTFVHNASLPTAPVTLCSQHVEWLRRQNREGAAQSCQQR